MTTLLAFVDRYCALALALPQSWLLSNESVLLTLRVYADAASFSCRYSRCPIAFIFSCSMIVMVDDDVCSVCLSLCPHSLMTITSMTMSRWVHMCVYTAALTDARWWCRLDGDRLTGTRYDGVARMHTLTRTVVRTHSPSSLLTY
jgi:hypothetical protein